MVLPTKYYRRLRTTNSQERLNEEIRRRDRVIRIYPNRASCERLLGALLIEFDEAMSCGKVYIGMEEYHAWRASQVAGLVGQVAGLVCRDAGSESAGSPDAFKGKEAEVLLTRC